MTAPTELEIKIAERLIVLHDNLGLAFNGISHGNGKETIDRIAFRKEYGQLNAILDELVERRLRMEYFGRTSIEPREERIE
jgi:hypothetical protein